MSGLAWAAAASPPTFVLGFVLGARYATTAMRRMIRETHEAMDAVEAASPEPDAAEYWWHGTWNDAPAVVDLPVPNADEILRDTARVAAERALLADVAAAVDRIICESCLVQRATHVVLWEREDADKVFAERFYTCQPCASMVRSGARVEPL